MQRGVLVKWQMILFLPGVRFVQPGETMRGITSLPSEAEKTPLGPLALRFS